MPKATVRIGDCTEKLRRMDSSSVHCCVTSPPYWGLRDYGHEEQIGLEESPDEYVNGMVGVFSEVKRVLRDDGTLWLNLGDSYATGTTADRQQSSNPGVGANRPEAQNGVARLGNPAGLKTKDQCLIPHRVAMALQADGWYLRSTIVWAKGNPMPESVTDRPTSSHEYVFLLSKSKRYFYDQDTIREPIKKGNDGSIRAPDAAKRVSDCKHNNNERQYDVIKGANKKDVWQINTKPFSRAHFAVYPPDLVEPCIKAGTSKKGVCSECGAPWERITERQPVEPDSYNGSNFSNGKTAKHQLERASEKDRTTKVATDNWQSTCDCEASEPVPATVLDPFAGSGTTGLVALKLGRHADLIELVPNYAQMAADRLRQECGGLFHDVIIQESCS